MTDHAGQYIDDYRLLRLLGAGGFGEVYLGEHLHDQTQVAVKIFTLSRENWKEFVKEASTTFRLKHPHIVPLLGFGMSADDIPYLIMDYAPNGTLRQRHPKGTILPLRTIISYLLPLSEALQYAHDKRIIHRDIKPENVLIGQNGDILLTDFGIAVVTPIERSLNTQNLSGTAPYMAPEQIRGKPQPASDQYALGIMVYEWLCGVRPFQGMQWEILDQHQSSQPPLLRERLPNLPLKVEEVVLKTLAKDPQERFVSVKAFALALEAAYSEYVFPSPSLPEISPSPVLRIPNHLIEGEVVTIKPTQVTGSQVIINRSNTQLPASADQQQMEAFPDTLVPRKPGVTLRRRGLIAGILMLTALLIASGIFILSPLATFATITITPSSKIEQDSYVIQAVTSNADPAKRQVSLRQLTFSPQEQPKSVTATGIGHAAPSAATGQLTFYNGSNQSYSIDTTTAIAGPNGVSVVPDTPVDVPASHPPTEGTITVNAHATTAGVNGNMAAGAINGTCCASGGFITVVNSAFTGGQDEKDYTYLQQNDVDSVVNQIKPALSQQALSGLKGQIKPNEQLVADPQCTTTPKVDQPIGDQGQNIASANITINAMCTEQAYDAGGAQTLAQNLLKSKAASSLGQGYMLAGTIITKQIVTDVKDDVVTLQVAVAGIWYYQFDDSQKLALAKQLVNDSRGTAQKLLDDYKGIAKAKIDITNGGNTLLGNPEQIHIVVLGVSGASSADLPAL